MQNFIGRIFIVTTLIATLSGCALAVRKTEVADLKYNPGRYHDKTVSIDGVVTSAWSLPLVPYKFYKVDDGTGEMTVLSQHGGSITKGAHVRVKGKVSDFASFGGQSLGLHLRESDLDYTGGR